MAAISRAWHNVFLFQGPKANQNSASSFYVIQFLITMRQGFRLAKINRELYLYENSLRFVFCFFTSAVTAILQSKGSAQNLNKVLM